MALGKIHPEKRGYGPRAERKRDARKERRRVDYVLELDARVIDALCYAIKG